MGFLPPSPCFFFPTRSPAGKNFLYNGLCSSHSLHCIFSVSISSYFFTELPCHHGSSNHDFQSHPVSLQLFNNPAHPYTIALMSSLPKMEVKQDKLYAIEGQPPDLLNLPPGCSFAPRCPKAMDICKQEYPPLSVVGEGRSVSCWLATGKEKQ